MGDIVSQNRGLGIGDLVRLNHDVDLATSLHGIGTLDAVMGVGDLLELLKTLDVVLSRLATGTGARAETASAACTRTSSTVLGSTSAW